MNRGKFIAFTMGVLSPVFAISQNLVPNPGFEIISNCNITYLDEPIINSIVDWYSYDITINSPNIFNKCYSLSALVPPNTVFGNSMPHSDSCMAGIGFIPSQQYREVISAYLIEPLVKDSAYCISFFAKNSGVESNYYYSNNLGVIFTAQNVNNNLVLNTEPIVFPDTLIVGNKWHKIEGYFIANGNENIVNIGYFGTKEKFESIKTPPDDIIYYFLDDISVFKCNKDSLLNVRLDLPNVLTANGDGKNDVYSIQMQNIDSLQLFILNRWGNVVRTYDGLTTVWDGTDDKGDPVPDGVYFVKAIARSRFGEWLNKTTFVHLIR